MRYAIFTDIHANLEALEAVLAKIDELAQQQSIDEIWFLGDLVGYGPNPNECIVKLRERTNVIIAGNHDWAAVGKIDLEDFSAAARTSAEWTAEQLTQEHRDFLINLPERIELDECTLVHGSPYGPLWEYLTSEVLAERSFQYFTTRYCFVGHTHVPVIFQQPDTLDTIANTPTLPLTGAEQDETAPDVFFVLPEETEQEDDAHATEEVVTVRATTQTTQAAHTSENAVTQAEETSADMTPAYVEHAPEHSQDAGDAEGTDTDAEQQTHAQKDVETLAHDLADAEENESIGEDAAISSEDTITEAEERLNGEIEELLALLGLSQSMVQVTNEMIVPPEGHWETASGHRAIINPGGVGQPRDGDPRAAFMIYDTEQGFTFYRVPYAFEKTQEKIIQVGLPQYLAARLAYGR